jgi:hypothetical protein
MQLKRVGTLVIAAVVLAVTVIGNASALTWNGQTDTSVMYSSAQWAVYIDMTGSATNYQYVSWGNGLNHGWPYMDSVKPCVSWYENMDGNGLLPYDNKYSSTLSYGQAWGINQNSHDTLKPAGGNFIQVWHKYYNPEGTWVLTNTTIKDHYYTH